MEKLETNLRNIEEVVKKYENEKAERLLRREKLERGEKEKRQKRSDRLLLKKSLEEKWEMMRWLVKYLDENEAQWETDRELRHSEETGEMTTQIEVEQDIPRVARLSPRREKLGRDAEEDVVINVQDLRTKIDKEVEKQRGNEVGTRSLMRIIQKFEYKLEAAVQRMARLMNKWKNMRDAKKCMRWS